MLNAILLDLDNTLILYDEPRFYQDYFKRLGPHFADILPGEKFVERLITATRALLQNNGKVTNAEYFLKIFSRGFADRKNDLWDRFLHFYQTDYAKLAANETLPHALHETIASMIRSGLKLVLASNPIFPFNVQMKRLAWAGLEQVPFVLVTHIENMSFCKPRIEYYLEICQKISEPPDACLMVGNDPVNDMTAALTGMKTYLTDNAGGAGMVSADNEKMLQKLQIEDIPAPHFTGPLFKVPSAVQHFTGSRPKARDIR